MTDTHANSNLATTSQDFGTAQKFVVLDSILKSSDVSVHYDEKYRSRFNFGAQCRQKAQSLWELRGTVLYIASNAFLFGGFVYVGGEVARLIVRHHMAGRSRSWQASLTDHLESLTAQLNPGTGYVMIPPQAGAVDEAGATGLSLPPAPSPPSSSPWRRLVQKSGEIALNIFLHQVVTRGFLHLFGSPSQPHHHTSAPMTGHFTGEYHHYHVVHQVVQKASEITEIIEIKD